MKLSPNQIQALARKILDHWKETHVVHFKADERVVQEKIEAVFRKEIQKEIDLDREVHAMLDQLERSHGGQFERHKMYPMLRNKMAKEKKVIL
ncbi:MAG: DUF507 family protein [Bdellovibrionaceae bacterium]|nr:DUF507 family protein [Pseudobdellovibrionaceae bacterium]MBX3034350.1 DUF507 family protein [Pseudobdellovibrionaceae bacterium]